MKPKKRKPTAILISLLGKKGAQEYEDEVVVQSKKKGLNSQGAALMAARKTFLKGTRSTDVSAKEVITQSAVTKSI